MLGMWDACARSSQHPRVDAHDVRTRATSCIQDGAQSGLSKICQRMTLCEWT